MTPDDFATIELRWPEPAIAEIRLNRPECLNAINFEMVAELHTALDVIAATADCKVVVLSGAGRAFSAGLDLKNWGRVPATGEHSHMPVGVDAQTFISRLTVHIRNTPQVVIAAVGGPAFGGGLALACASDIRVASPAATFCSAFIRTGLSGTDIGVTYLLPRLVGWSRGFDLILTGREVDAAEALDMGLVAAVVDDVADAAFERARTMAGFTASGLRSTKEVLWLNGDAPSLDVALALEIRNQNLVLHAPDVQEFMAGYSARITGSTDGESAAGRDGGRG